MTEREGEAQERGRLGAVDIVVVALATTMTEPLRSSLPKEIAADATPPAYGRGSMQSAHRVLLRCCYAENAAKYFARRWMRAA